MLEALAKEEITVQMITTGDIKISVLVERSSATRALQAVHRAFGLDAPLDDVAAPFVPCHPIGQRRHPAQSGNGWIPVRDHSRDHDPAQGLEDLVISGVELDDRQGRIFP
jgi:aspartate kinase